MYTVGRSYTFVYCEKLDAPIVTGREEPCCWQPGWIVPDNVVERWPHVWYHQRGALKLLDTLKTLSSFGGLTRKVANHRWATSAQCSVINRIGRYGENLQYQRIILKSVLASTTIFIIRPNEILYLCVRYCAIKIRNISLALFVGAGR